MNAQNLVAWLPFDTSTTQDLCGNEWTAYGDVSLSSEITKFGTASIHLPSGAYLSANNILDLNADKWTFNCWCLRVSSSGDEGFFGLGEGSSRRGIIVGHDGVYIATSGGGSWQQKNSSLRLPSELNQWKHLEIDKDDTSLKFFENGSLVWSTTINGLNDTGVFLIGGNSYGYTNDLYFAEVMFYDGVALHTENFTPPTNADYLQLRLDMGLPAPFEFDADTVRQVVNATWTPQKNLAVWLPFDESTTQDLCGNTWTAQGSPTISNGELQLNGSSYLQNDSIAAEIGSDIWTVHWQGICTENGNDHFFFGTHNANYSTTGEGSHYWIAINYNSGNPMIILWGDDTASNLSLSLNQRYHYALSYDGINLRLFVDGVLKVTKAIDVTLGGAFRIGCVVNRNNGRNTATDFFKGTIDNFIILKGEAWTQDFTPPTQDDYLQLRLDMGLPVPFEFDADTARQVVNANGQLNSIYFDGTSSYGIFPTSVVQTLSMVTSYTFEITFSTKDTRTGSDSIYCSSLLSYNRNNLIASNVFTLSLENGSPWVRTTYDSVFLKTSAKLNDGVPHTLAMVKDGTLLKLYADGSLIGTKDGFNQNFIDTTRTFYLGTTLALRNFLQMDLYEARLWSRALSDEELFTTFSGLVAHYLPELRTDNILPDISNNENHMTLYGAAAPQWSFALDADIECAVANAAYYFGYEGIDAVTTSKLIRVEDDTFNLTGSAFYSADLTLPPMQEVWIEFSVCNRDLDGWQVGNDHDNFTGIAGETPDGQDTSTPLDFAAYNLNSVISNDTSGLTKGVQTFLMHMIADDTDGLIEVWIDGVPHYTYRGSVNGGTPFDKMFLHSSGVTCFQSFRISNTEFPSKQIIILDFDVEALVVNEAFAWSVDETHVERYWAPPGGTSPPWFVDVVVHDRTAWYQTVVTKAFDLPPTYHLWIDFDVYFDGVHHWRAGNIGESDFCGASSALTSTLRGFSNGEQIYPTTNLLRAAGGYEWTPVLVHLQSGTDDGVLEAWFNGDKVFAYTGNVNDGEPFADPVLQSDGAGTYFSYLLFSTNPLEPRRNVDTIELCLLRNGQVLTYPLYAYETCDALALAVRYDGRNWYNVLRERASDFYILHDETIYALTKG